MEEEPEPELELKPRLSLLLLRGLSGDLDLVEPLPRPQPLVEGLEDSVAWDHQLR